MMEVQNLSERHVWNLIFEAHHSAEKFANNYNLSKGTDDQRRNLVFNRYSEKQSSYLNSAKAMILPRSTSLPKIVSNIKNYSVVEFGGGSGWLLEILLRSDQERILSYTIIETAEVIEYFSKSMDYDRRLIWSELETFKGIEISPTILYANSVLQYFEDNNSFLRLVTRCNPEIIVLDDLLMAPNYEVFTLQNYYGFVMVNRLQSKSKLIAEVESLGYQVSECEVYVSNIANEMSRGIWLSETHVLNEPEHSSMVFVRSSRFDGLS